MESSGRQNLSRRARRASAERWELETGCALRTLQGHAGQVNAVAVTPDGRYAVSASADQTLKVWELESGRALRALQDYAASVKSECCTLANDWTIIAVTPAAESTSLHSNGRHRDRSSPCDVACCTLADDRPIIRVVTGLVPSRSISLDVHRLFDRSG